MSRFLIALTLIRTRLDGTRSRRNKTILPGRVTLSDSKVIPPGAILKVSLRDPDHGRREAATIANASFEAEGKPPIRFELPYPETSIEPKRLYGVAAVITDSRGKPLWETRVPIRVLTLGNQKKVELLLRPASVPETPAPEAMAFALDCGTAHFEVTLADRAATIVGPDSKIALPASTPRPERSIQTAGRRCPCSERRSTCNFRARLPATAR